mgnify:CR=1 FL=1
MDVRDIAAVAAAALTEAGHDGATYTVTGPAPITHADIAAALTSALGRNITFVDVPSDAFAESLQGILPPWQIQGLLEDYAHYRRGRKTVKSVKLGRLGGDCGDLRKRLPRGLPRGAVWDCAPPVKPTRLAPIANAQRRTTPRRERFAKKAIAASPFFCPRTIS